MQQEVRLRVLEAREVVSLHHCFHFADPFGLIQGEVQLIFGLVAALLELEEDEEARKVVDDVVV